ncbi:MAG: hypothetical protein QOJ85_2718 [Solirubrobacteraceae bacterium]|nr:hypothetical protein [Solirubrobacteraceae bacterium]
MTSDARFDEPAGVLRLAKALAERVPTPTLAGVRVTRLGCASAGKPRSLDLLGNETGWLKVHGDEEPAAMVPIGTAELWRELVRLVEGDASGHG